MPTDTVSVLYPLLMGAQDQRTLPRARLAHRRDHEPGHPQLRGEPARRRDAGPLRLGGGDGKSGGLHNLFAENRPLRRRARLPHGLPRHAAARENGDRAAPPPLNSPRRAAGRRCESPEPLQAAGKAHAGACLGDPRPETAASFYGYLRDRQYEMPSAETILSDYDAVREPMEKLAAGNSARPPESRSCGRSYSLATAAGRSARTSTKCSAASPRSFALLFFKFLAGKSRSCFTNIAGELHEFDKILRPAHGAS